MYICSVLPVARTGARFGFGSHFLQLIYHVRTQMFSLFRARIICYLTFVLYKNA